MIEGNFVVVVGLGGVGSHAAHMLARAGVSRIRLIDFDNVTLSSLNRHAVAVRADVGRPKVECLKRFFHSVVPHVEVDARVAMFEAAAAEELLAGKPDYVLDCIDDMTTKTDLLKFCYDKRLRVISSMGAGAKADPTRLHICNISEVVSDPLAARLRQSLRKAGMVNLQTCGINVVYSSERPTRKLCALEGEAAEAPQEFGALENFRVRILPVLGTTPAVFGNALAAQVLCELARQPFRPDPSPHLWNAKAMEKMLRKLIGRERAVFGNTEPVLYLPSDLHNLLHYVWKYRSAVSGDRGALELTRWRRENGPVLRNYVLLTVHEVRKLERAGDPSVFGDEVCARIDAALASLPEVIASVP